jgi:uncharacterized protein (TIGR02246 family)
MATIEKGLARTLFVGLALVTPVRADAASGTEADSSAIRSVVAELDAAWAQADGKRWAAQFQPDAEFINVSGLLFAGVDAIRARHEAIWSEHFRGSHSTGTLRRLVFLAPNVAIADVDFAVTGYAYLPTMGARPTEPGVILSRMRHIMVRANGRWRIAASQNTLVAPPPAGP